MHGKIKRYKDVINIKEKECFSNTLVAETLWQYVGINGSLYGMEIGEINEGIIKKMENYQNEVGRWNIGSSS